MPTRSSHATISKEPWLILLALIGALAAPAADTTDLQTDSPSKAKLFPLTSIRLLESPFARGVAANRAYMLQLDPDRLLAPFLREAGLAARKPPYGNWESGGLDGHTAGHYLSALSLMSASGADTPQGELRRRLNYMVSEMDRCQKAFGDGYVGGVPGSRALWAEVAEGHIEAFRTKWVPWYNLHKTFAGLRDAWLVAGNAQAREVLLRLADWCDREVSGLSDQQMQKMLDTEHGGMNEVLADVYAMSGDQKYLKLARRFCHQAVLGPLMDQQDRLTGLHANTQIPKVIGLERIAALDHDEKADSGARFFWDTVTRRRTVVFGGNSVSEHFNAPTNFLGMLENREGPETCNTYNMLRLTEQLFLSKPTASYADFYERALYNHILASINPSTPGYVYFTPIRPEHYRVYSQPERCFWCCVGTGMENPGKYSEFIYAQTGDDIYINLFIASELSVPDRGLKLRQETAFPDEPRARLKMQLKRPSTFTLRIRHPGWVAAADFKVRVNGRPISVTSTPSSYAALHRTWRDGDRVEIDLPMRTTVERLPDGSDWVAVLRGPIVLAAPAGTNDLVGLRADGSRMGHVARGPLVPMDRVPVLLATAAELPKHILPDPDQQPLHFRLAGVAEPASIEGLPLVPFFRLHDSRYQMYWELTTKEGLATRQERRSATERLKIAREAATLDSVAIGEQQPEVEHGFAGEETESGEFQGRRWRHGRQFQYTLDTHGASAAEFAVTYFGGDLDRNFDVFANDTLLGSEGLKGEKPGEFFERRYPVPASVLSSNANGRVTIRFSAHPGSRAGGIFELRLMRPGPTSN
jgi:uncharacterized protein